MLPECLFRRKKCSLSFATDVSSDPISYGMIVVWHVTAFGIGASGRFADLKVRDRSNICELSTSKTSLLRMRPLARQSARLASHSRASSRSRVRQSCIAAPQHPRSFSSTARQTSDRPPPNGTPEHTAWQEQQRDERRRTENAPTKPEPEPQRTDEAENGETKVNGEGRRGMTKRTRVQQARRASEVPKPPPIPDWFMKNNVHLVRDTVSESAEQHWTKEVLRCVDTSTGHTLFTVPYYEAPVPPMTTVVRGKEVDVSSLALKKDVLTGLPDHLKEEMMIHHLQVQRARKAEEIDQEGLAELLVALPRDMQEEILRREAVEGKRAKRDKSADYVRTDAAKKPSKTNTLGRDFFGQKAPGHTAAPSESSSASPPTLMGASSESYPLLSWVLLEAEASVAAGLSLANTTQPAVTFSSSRVDLSLVCPNPDSSDSLNRLVGDLARSVNADVIKLDAMDFAQLTSDYVDGGRDAPGSFANLGYDVFEGLHAKGLKPPMQLFAATEKDDEGFDMDEDEMDEDDEEEDDSRGSNGVEFGTLDDLRKALEDKRGALGKALSGMGIAGLSIGVSKGMAFGGNSAPPGFMTAGQRPRMMPIDEDGEEPRFNAARLTALLDQLVDAAKLKRAESRGLDKANAHAESGAVAKEVLAKRDREWHASRVSTARMLATYAASSETMGENPVKLQSEPAQTSQSDAQSAAPSQRTIIHVPDLRDLYRSGLGSNIVQSLVKVVQKRRRGGESIMVVGTTAQDPMNSLGFHQMSDFPFRSLAIPPLFRNSTNELKKLEASVLPVSGGLPVSRDERIVDINLRHLSLMMRRLRPGEESVATDYRAGGPSTRAQLALEGTHGLTERVLSLDQVQRLALTAIGLAETHARAGKVQPIHLALSAIVTGRVDQIVQTWESNDRMSRMPKALRPGGKGKEASGGAGESGPTKVEEIKASCNQHETRLLTGVVDAKNIKTGFADVHAPKETIEALKTLTSLSLMRPEAFSYGVLANDRLPGLLLYGPPGTGKTLLAKAVAKESSATVLEITGAQIYEKYVGEGEKMVRAVFSLAKKLSPCVVFLDEADAVLGSRHSGGGNRNTHRELINQFLREWDGMDDHGVFIMVASNRPFDLDDAVLRRLPRRLLVDLPVVKDRQSILGIHLKTELLDPAVDLAKLAEQTPLYSGSDLKNLCVSAALACVREENELAVSKQDDKDFQLPEKRILMPRHFDKAIAEISASISEDMGSLGAIRKFDEQFGDRRGRKKKTGYGFGSGEEVVDERSVMVRQREVGSASPPP